MLSFYRELPFNTNESPEIAAELIKKNNNVQYIYPTVQDFFYIDTALEMGCGTGWLSNSIAYYYGVNMTGIDFNPTAIDMASKTANALDVDVTFKCDDLFQYECAPKDMVISIGVLHHTSNCEGGIKRCIELTKSNGKIFIGLYHKYGRAPFLNYFDQLKSGGATEEYLFRKYQELDGRHADNIQKKSWFLDQVLHPYETQHTLREVVEIFREMNVKLISTSINHFDRIDDINELYRAEEKLYDVGMQYLNMNKYYPGFFYVLGQKE